MDQLKARKNPVLNTLLHRGLVTTERVRKPQWVTVDVIRRISETSLQTALDKGTRSWDELLSSVLGIVLQAALCSRAGDIMRDPIDDPEGGKILVWADIDMRLNDGGNSVDDLRAVIVLRNEKHIR